MTMQSPSMCQKFGSASPQTWQRSSSAAAHSVARWPSGPPFFREASEASFVAFTRACPRALIASLSGKMSYISS